MTVEHLRPLLDDADLCTLSSWWPSSLLAQVPDGVVDLVRLGRLSALIKPDGGVRGIVAGDVFRRLVARTMSQQLDPAVERATSPDQYAMTTKAGCECIAHALQSLTELYPEATITSIDGVGACDLISHRAMLEGLQRVSAEVVPFARLFHGRRSEVLWESDYGEVHSVPQGEGGEQGDAMMPCCLHWVNMASCKSRHGHWGMASTSWHSWTTRQPGWANLWFFGERFVEERGHPHPQKQNANLEPSGHQRVDVANQQTRHQIVGDPVGPSRFRCQAPQVRHGRASSPLATNSA